MPENIEILKQVTGELIEHNKLLGQVVEVVAVSRKRNVLIVDDEVMYTSLFKKLMEQTDHYTVETVNDSLMAIDAIKAFKPHIVVLDCMMPNVNGFELAGQIQSDPDLKDIPFVFLTAYETEPKASENCQYRGSQIFLPKTMAMAQLDEALQLILKAPQ